MTIQAAISGANDLLLAGVSAILDAPDYPPDMLPNGSMIISYYGGGISSTQSAGMTKDLFNIVCEFHVMRIDLIRDTMLLMASIDDIKDALLDDSTLDGNCSTFQDIEISRPIPGEYGGQQTLMLRFTIRGVKINS